MLNYSGTDSIPWPDEFDEIIETATKGRDVAKDVIILALLEFADRGSTEHADVFPPYLRNVFRKLANYYSEYWKAGGK